MIHGGARWRWWVRGGLNISNLTRKAHFDRVRNDTLRRGNNDCAEEARKRVHRLLKLRIFLRNKKRSHVGTRSASLCFQIPQPYGVPLSLGTCSFGMQRLSRICTLASESRPRRLPSSTPPFGLHSPRFVKSQDSSTLNLNSSRSHTPLPPPGTRGEVHKATSWQLGNLAASFGNVQ